MNFRYMNTRKFGKMAVCINYFKIICLVNKTVQKFNFICSVYNVFAQDIFPFG